MGFCVMSMSRFRVDLEVFELDRYVFCSLELIVFGMHE